ncbi:transporter [Testudinibacter sp. TR-2022]|uniref:efflux RND transporter permease subunit n=1 Tax=Testudinibacter sp. TR-2022 TaxID=2585029 RepID=UPI00111944F0|nr:efflux RND transporter permease subunit [Testudinibacter sp. TR-2022]TNH03611.1 transporter [Pasteurellaceae bacterium Phil31]TNH07401.1 transporter [Testudinibacter sp. TR-2022]TNH09429.1 transporter [Testudinibacter sp. TR-2022]TNH12536.1 transporter [Testudinibacter sp. TR-2022]TNH15492.1 transporter [Testudinibacter sp. TR-2022]
MRFTDIFIRRPVLAAAISILIVILGLQAVSKLSVREYPKMTTTVINVSTVYAGADANLIQAFVTSQLEEAIAQADNIDYMSSSSRQSVSTITVKMKLNTDPNAALADILAKVNSVRSALPSDIDDPTITSSTGGSGMMYVSFTSEQLDPSQVTDYIQRVVKPQFFTIPGVAKVDIFGGTPYAMRIWLDPQKMAALGLSAPRVMTALSSNNVQTAAGSTNGWYTVIKNKVNTTTTDVEQLKNLVISADNDKLVHLSDIATVELDQESDNARAVANGENAVVLSIEPASSANPLTVIDNIYPLLDTIQKNLPPSIQAKVLYDRTIAINSSIEEVVKTILEATLIVLVVITMFLGSFRAMIVPVVTIPISLIGVIMLLQAFDFSINLMTLLAMILAIGLVVDDAIVVLENIDRHIKLGETPFRAAIIGTREIAVPVISMTIALCAVYSPMALMGGITGTLFKEFALTLAGAVLISGVIALTLSPMMCANLLKASATPSKLERCVEGFLHKLTEGYRTLLALTMANRFWVLGFAAVIFTTLPVLFSSLSSELVPNEDKGALLAIGTTSANKNIDYVQDSMKAYETLLKETPEIQFSQIISGVPASNNALAIATLADWSERSRSQAEIMADLNNKAKHIPEISVSGFPFPEIDTGEQGMPVSFVITTPNGYSDLVLIAQSVWQAAQQSGQFIFSNLDLSFDTAEMHMDIDMDKANSYGITMSQISSTLGSFLSGATVTRVDIEGRAYKIISEVERKKRLNPESMNSYSLIAADGRSVPLSSLIKLELKTQPLSLPRFNQLNSAVISGVPSGSIGDAVQWFQTSGAELLPQGYTYDFRGESRQYVQEGNTLATTFGLAVIIIFLVLAIQFESIRDPLVIMVSVPLAISGALLMLNLLNFLGLAGTTLNIYSEVGLITLVGLITKHGILMCEVAKEEQLLHGKNRIEAISEAARIRLRPILMTTAAMIAGLIPLLYASGAGAISRFSIGVVIISGLAIGTLFTLFVLPVIYSFIASQHKPLPEFDENQPAIEDHGQLDQAH